MSEMKAENSPRREGGTRSGLEWPESVLEYHWIAGREELLTKFQNTSNEESKERIVAHLTNFAYDPYNYAFLHQLNVLELFMDCITEPNEKLVEFGIGGICNSCVGDLCSWIPLLSLQLLY